MTDGTAQKHAEQSLAEAYPSARRMALVCATVLLVGALLITVVRQKNGDGHAVLTVTTSRGDLVLDNLDPHISLWSGTGYRYLKRQSEYDSGEWVEIEDGRANEVGSLTN